MKSGFRIASWNIACGAGERYCARHLDRMITQLRAQSCDIILLQEVDRNRFRSENRDIPAIIADKLQFSAVFAPALIADDGEYGNAILTRLPIRQTATLGLGPDGDDQTGENENRSAAWAAIDIHGLPVQVFSTHLAVAGAAPTIRQLQVERLVHFITTQPIAPVIGGGDFNVATEHPDLALLNDTLDVLALELGPTCLDQQDQLCYAIDHFYGRHIQCMHSIKYIDPNLSDHALIVAACMLGA